MTISITTNTSIPTFGVVASTSWHQKSTALRSNAMPLKSIDHSILATLPYQHIFRSFSATPLQHKHGLDHIRTFTPTAPLKRKRKEKHKTNILRANRTPYQLHGHGVIPCQAHLGVNGSLLRACRCARLNAAAELGRYEAFSWKNPPPTAIQLRSN
ncbi:hypothetical protein CI102_9291 [Trichoderma harzianum]|nr:hypothetical protein CI102_9291 [Trichoderma harzianum]